MKTMLNIKTDKKLKEEAQKIAKVLGLPLGTVVNRYLKDFVRERRIEFTESVMPNAKTQKLLERIEKDLGEGKNLSPAFSTADRMDAYLNS